MYFSNTIFSGNKTECCPKQKVGSHTYTLIKLDSEEDGLDMEGCLEQCAYRYFVTHKGIFTKLCMPPTVLIRRSNVIFYRFI